MFSFELTLLFFFLRLSVCCVRQLFSHDRQQHRYWRRSGKFVLVWSRKIREEFSLYTQLGLTYLNRQMYSSCWLKQLKHDWLAKLMLWGWIFLSYL